MKSYGRLTSGIVGRLFLCPEGGVAFSSAQGRLGCFEKRLGCLRIRLGLFEKRLGGEPKRRGYRLKILGLRPKRLGSPT